MKLWSVILVAMLSVVHLDADARRMGGGKSIGKQSSNVTQREAAPPAAPAAPMQQNAANSAAPKPAAAPNAAAGAPKKPWGAMLGGLAAGLGLAWLANSLGLGAAFGNFLLIALLALVVMVVIGMVMRARKPAASQAASSPFAFQGAGAPAPVDVQMPRQYNPEKVGNDASARPWEQFSASPQQGGGSMIGSALAGSQNWGVPADFDAEGFLAAAKRNFTTLQAAWDRSDIATLRSMMTDGMLDEIRAQLAEREAQRAGEHPNHTEVVILEAQLLGIEDLGDAYMASVEFSGMIREEPSAGPSPFREVWNMTKPKSGTSGWLVAGLQALQ
ncbi:MAG TPA: Tim44-like domain-containing protein [Alicycliphilus sp.]|jgi:predicted lipid-binding transport protein (Tim44 family)|nr:Tim44 domain-containing protein [Alicycliphilus sp.]MBP7324586.1 Tim44 domain-containing protein [Alicycliphilus sp.]MBP7329513.1 Tim44 domain-containing protein [Alicycliphilus sp.]MBP8778238.1 Tim44 domain-containing protein [Alicycliphilus sp.]TXJ13936.1 MAG: Tim44 domain-containing protein [Alicycliphilus sp.]